MEKITLESLRKGRVMLAWSSWSQNGYKESEEMINGDIAQTSQQALLHYETIN